MFLEFPFEYAEIEGLGRLFYPIVKVQLKTIIGWREFGFLVDTGADVTTIPSHVLPVLGIKKNQLSTSTTLGVGGISVNIWEFQTLIRFATSEVLIHCSAVETKDDSIPLLLGRKDIFEKKFNLLLDSRRKITVISQNSL